MKNQFTNDNRGVSEVIGAILVFGLLIALMAIIQTQAIPAANEEVEFNHNQRVQGDLVDLHTSAIDTGTTGEPASSNIEMGAHYPARLLFFSPHPPTSTLATSEEHNVSIGNVHSEDEFAQQYFSGDVSNLTTQHLTFTPQYNEYRSAPTTHYEYGMMYNEHDSTQDVVNSGGVIEGNDIMLTFMVGDMSKTTSGTMSVETRPVSAPARRVPITGNGDGPIVLNLPSELNATQWSESFDSKNVLNVTETEGGVRVELDPEPTYTLRMAQVGVGGGTPEQDPTYLYPPDGDNELTVTQSQTTELGVEVRDKYNNPVPNEDVSIEIADGEGAIASDSSSNNDGVVSELFEAPGATGMVTVHVTLDSADDGTFDRSDPEDLEMNIWVTDNRVTGPAPAIEQMDITQQACVSGDSLGDYIDDPVESISGLFGGSDSDYSVITVNWSVSQSGASSEIDTVELRMVNEGDRQIVDDAHFSYTRENSTNEASETTDLVKAGCDGPYEVQLIATSTRGASDSEPRHDIELE